MTPIEVVSAEGPHFEDLQVGDVFSSASGLTLTEGHAATHQAIVGDRLRIGLDHELSRRMTGRQEPLASPALVWDVAIGQSTSVTQHVVANLFYRGLAFRRAPHLGDTLRTRTEVVALRQNSAKPGRTATGLAALRITTTDQHDEPVLDFWRCAMLPLRARPPTSPPAGTSTPYETATRTGRVRSWRPGRSGTSAAATSSVRRPSSPG